MKKVVNITAFLLLSAFVVLASCTKICDEPPVDDLNALYLKFNTEGEDSFTEEELESFYMVRYFDVPGDSLTFPDDTVFYHGHFYEGSAGQIRLSNHIPFRNDSIFYVRYNYGLYFESDSTLSYIITDIDLEGTYVGECDYENVKKTFHINDQLVDMSASTDYYEIKK